MNKDSLDYLNSLFGIVEQCAKHGSFNRISNAVMTEIKRFEDNPDLLKEAPNAEQPNE